LYFTEKIKGLPHHQNNNNNNNKNHIPNISPENKQWWLMPVTPALRRQEECEFETSLWATSMFKARLGYIVIPCLKTKRRAKT
jgi:hypothetical protein